MFRTFISKGLLPRCCLCILTVPRFDEGDKCASPVEAPKEVTGEETCSGCTEGSGAGEKVGTDQTIEYLEGKAGLLKTQK